MFKKFFDFILSKIVKVFISKLSYFDTLLFGIFNIYFLNSNFSISLSFIFNLKPSVSSNTYKLSFKKITPELA